MEFEIELGGLEIEIKGWRGIATLAAAGLVGAALIQQLSRPPRQRTWHGSLAGVVPYDFRPPTIERIREAFWDPNNPQVLTPQPFGVGWTVNLGAIAERMHLA